MLDVLAALIVLRFLADMNLLSLLVGALLGAGAAFRHPDAVRHAHASVTTAIRDTMARIQGLAGGGAGPD